MLHVTIRNDDFLAQHSTSTLLRHCFEWMQHCPNIATLCYAQNRCSESSRVTSPLVKDDLPQPFPIGPATEVSFIKKLLPY